MRLAVQVQLHLAKFADGKLESFGVLQRRAYFKERAEKEAREQQGQ